MPAEFNAVQLQARFANISARFAELEAQVAILSEKAGVPYQPASSEAPAEVVELVRAGKNLDAIKRYRELMGATADEARDAIAKI
jgi:ribosomal protein L7/L12